MKNEAVDALDCKDGLIYVDCTLGGGGHSELILKKIQPNGKLIAFDIDQDAIDAASERLKDYKNLTIVKSSYTNIKQVLKDLGIKKITGGILFDLGASYHQLTKQERGFSFSKEAPLDMRFNMDSDFSAYDVVNNYKEEELETRNYTVEDIIKIGKELEDNRKENKNAKEILSYAIQKCAADHTSETTVSIVNLPNDDIVNGKINYGNIDQVLRCKNLNDYLSIINTNNNFYKLLDSYHITQDDEIYQIVEALKEILTINFNYSI